MCSGSDQLTSKAPSSSLFKDMNDSIKIIQPDTCNLLELAANDDVDGFKQSISRTPSAINEVGFWYGRQRSSKRMIMDQRTPLMIAATYGSVDVVKLILSFTEVDVNSSHGLDKSTALHCAASGGSPNAFDVIKVLLISGADPDLVDADGRRPVDVLVVPANLPNLKISIVKLLKNDGFWVEQEEDDLGLTSLKSIDKREYPIDPFYPDLKSDQYSTDDFRMFAFKIRPCSRAYSHDWTECPFIHPGESARRRDPRKIHYSCVPCPDFKKGQCRRGDLCEFAHGVFECWLHPAQYRTRLCKDGTFCARRVCFFAHTPEELRPLYVSTGSAMPSPRGSPAAASTMSPPFSPPPMLQLHGGNLQASRLRLSFNARDAHAEELKLLLDLEMHQRQQAAVFSPAVVNQLSPVNPYSPKGFDYWGSPTGMEQPHFSSQFSKWDYAKQVDWSVTGGEPAPARRLQATEPDVSWVQSLVKEPPPTVAPVDSPENEKNDHAALGAWLENMQLDQIVA